MRERTRSAALRTMIATAAGLATLGVTTMALPPGPAGAADPLAGYYAQSLRWSACGPLECARLTVPMSYDDLSLGDITIAVTKAPHTGDTRQGSLVVNPGGPGAPGADFASTVADAIAPDVAEQFDIIGFDPRGVGKSTPIACVTDRQLTRWVDADPSPDSPAQVRAVMAAAAPFAAECARRAPVLSRHLGTRLVARDLDVLRAALGSERLDYLGFSYGTLLGVRYAEAFPERVGRFVLDGAVDPRLDAMQVSAGQSAGFQSAMRAFAADCATQSRCVATTPSGVLDFINQLLTRLDRAPMRATSGRPLLEGQAVTALFTSMYDRSMWPQLRRALLSAKSGNGKALQDIADQTYDRVGPDEYIGNATEAFYAIACWDSPAPPSAAGLAAAGRRWSRGAAVPVMGEAMAWSNAPCSTWFGHEPAATGPARTTTQAPIVVVGTTNDPATPYAWAVSLSRQLPTSTLVTFVGEGHTAYGNDSRCLQQALDSFLLTGVPPASGTRCTQRGR